MTTFDVLGAALAIALAVLALLAGTRLLRWTVAVLPLSRPRRATAMRWLPAVQLVFGIAVLVLVAIYTLGRTHALVVAAAATTLVGAAAWFAIRDIIAGVVLRAEHDLSPGSLIRADDAVGRVHRAGPRSVAIETADGQRVRVPWSRLGSRPLSVTRPRESGGALHFTVTLPRRSGSRDDIARIRAAALHAFFASARREPHIRLAGEDDRSRIYEVTIHAADPAFLPAIEEAVSAHLASG
jgi:small-conductance mechanosensitive channel